jgi:hypothetical protein
MKALTTLLACLICIQLLACKKNYGHAITSDNTSATDTMRLIITIGTRAFTATLYNNETASAFKAKLPISVTMKDLNSNEKYVDLPGNLPANAFKPATIKAGDLMLYGSNTLVLFYKTFSTGYSYTPLARIDDPEGLAAAIGAGDVTVNYGLQ